MKSGTGKLQQLRNKAKREGWLDEVRTEADERALLDGYYFDNAKADHCADFFPRYLRHAKNVHAGKPFHLLDWQRDDLIRPLYGWMRPDGLRRFRRAYVQIPKKNGKSTLAAGIGLYMLAADGEVGSQVYSAATDKDQARIVHKEAIDMVDASPKLQRQLKVNRSTNTIRFGNSIYRALSARPAGSEGLDGHCAIIDELHAWKGRDLWDALRWMGAGRREPLIFIITTSGEDFEGVCYELYEYTKRVLGGTVVDHRFFPLVYEATAEETAGDGMLDLAIAKKCNPSLGHTIDEQEFMDDVREAVSQPKSRRALRRYRFNEWIQTTDVWLDIDLHHKNTRSYTWADLQGMRCWGGLDLSKTSDLTAFSLVFKWNDLDWRRLNWFWMPEARAIELRDKHNSSHEQWAEQGYLTITDGNVCNYSKVMDVIGWCSENFELEEVAYDPWNAESFTQDMEEDFDIERYEFRQSMANFSDPCEEYERLLKLGQLHHNGNQVLGWQTGHVEVKTDENNNMRPVKKKDSHKTIDGIVADIMALSRGLLAEKETTGNAFIC